MWPDWVSNPGPLTYESGALPTALRGPANFQSKNSSNCPFLHTQNTQISKRIVHFSLKISKTRHTSLITIGDGLGLGEE